MQMLYDLFPLLVFFIAYKWLGIYPATAIAIILSVLQLGFHWFKYKKFDIMQVITAVVIIVFGSMTLLLHNDIFIKWKPSVINAVFAIVFLATPYFKHKTLLEYILASKVEMPAAAWKQLNHLWIGFFIFVAVVNLFVVYHFSTDQWVNFKVFGILVLTLIFGIIQTVYISKRANLK